MSTKIFGVIAISIVSLMLFVGAVTAAVLPNATPETNGISSITVIECDGLVTMNSDYTVEHSNQFLDGAPLESGEVYGAASYNSRMIGLKGVTSLVKTASFNTQNQVTDGQNIDVTTLLYFDSDEGGIAVGDESIAQFNAGQAGLVVGDSQLCPFTDSTDETVSPFNEYSEMGSHFNVNTIDMVTSAGATTTAATIDIPSKINYNVAASGIGDISAYMNVFAQDGRGDGTYLVTPEKTTTVVIKEDKEDKNPKFTYGKDGKDHKDKTVTTVTPAVWSAPTPSSVTTYHDYSSASGKFTFAKIMTWSSGTA